MSNERERAIREREQAATKGPWLNGWLFQQCREDHKHDREVCLYRLREIQEGGTDILANVPALGEVGAAFTVCGVWDYDTGGVQRQEDATFIAHSRDDIPWLLARVARLREAYNELLADAKLSVEGVDGLCIAQAQRQGTTDATQYVSEEAGQACRRIVARRALEEEDQHG